MKHIHSWRYIYPNVRKKSLIKTSLYTHGGDSKEWGSAEKKQVERGQDKRTKRGSRRGAEERLEIHPFI